MTLRERIWAKVSIDPVTGCWNWTGAKSKTGNVYYGFIGVGGNNTLAHRTMYRLERGEIPPKMHLDHLCRNTLCVNPNHLEPVPARENTRRGTSPVAANFDKTHCPQGHPYDEANTDYVQGTYGTPWRHCRECGRIKSRLRQQQKALAPRPVSQEALPSHCRNGHAYDETNTYWRGSYRGCKACRLAAGQRWRARHPEWWAPYGEKRRKKGIPHGSV